MTNAQPPLNWRLFATVFRGSYETITPPQDQSGNNLKRTLGLDEGYQNVKDPLTELHHQFFNGGGGSGSSTPHNGPRGKLTIDVSCLATVNAKPHPYANKPIRTSDHTGTLSAEPTHVVLAEQNGRQTWTLCYSASAADGTLLLYSYPPAATVDEVPGHDFIQAVAARNLDLSIDRSGHVILRAKGATSTPWTAINAYSFATMQAIIDDYFKCPPLNSLPPTNNSLLLNTLRQNATQDEASAFTTEFLLKAATLNPDAPLSRDYLRLIDTIRQRWKA